MREKLLQILDDSTSPESMTWLRSTLESQSADFHERPFYYAFSGVSRHFEKNGAISVAVGNPFHDWDHFRAARVLLLLVLAEQEKEIFVKTFLALLNTADLREQIALFSALPSLPHPEELLESAVDGLRSNIVDIFDSIALDNAFPKEHFSDEAWNQMVLKAIFITRPLHRVIGIEDRRNQNLAEAISDLAHERWAAGRSITPEAWRSMIGFLDKGHSNDIRKIAESENADNRAAAALVVHESGSDLDDLRETLAAELTMIADGSLTWLSLGQEMEQKLIRKSLT